MNESNQSINDVSYSLSPKHSRRVPCKVLVAVLRDFSLLTLSSMSEVNDFSPNTPHPLPTTSAPLLSARSSWVLKISYLCPSASHPKVSTAPQDDQNSHCHLQLKSLVSSPVSWHCSPSTISAASISLVIRPLLVSQLWASVPMLVHGNGFPIWK